MYVFRFGHIEYRSKAVVLVPGRTPIESLEESFSLVSKNPSVSILKKNYKT